jgi:hypothetical protein
MAVIFAEPGNAKRDPDASVVPVYAGPGNRDRVVVTPDTE